VVRGHRNSPHEPEEDLYPFFSRTSFDRSSPTPRDLCRANLGPCLCPRTTTSCRARPGPEECPAGRPPSSGSLGLRPGTPLARIVKERSRRSRCRLVSGGSVISIADHGVRKSCRVAGARNACWADVQGSRGDRSDTLLRTEVQPSRKTRIELSPTPRVARHHRAWRAPSASDNIARRTWSWPHATRVATFWQLSALDCT